MTRVIFSEGSRLRVQICISLVNSTWEFQLLPVEYEHAYGHSLCVFQANLDARALLFRAWLRERRVMRSHKVRGSGDENVFQASQNSTHHISTDGKTLPQPLKNQQTTYNSSIRYDEGLTLETSSFQIFHGGNSNFINSFDETKFSCFTLPQKQHISCVRNENFVKSKFVRLFNFFFWKLQGYLSIFLSSKVSAWFQKTSLFLSFFHFLFLQKLYKVPPYTIQIDYARVNHNKFMVTDRVAYVGTSNWSADYFLNTAGVGYVVNETEAVSTADQMTLRANLQAVFERNWNSSYTTLVSC